MTIGLTNFREAQRMGALLASARSRGERFDAAWSEAIAQLRPSGLRPRDDGLLAARWKETKAALEFGKDAWRRAYLREQPTRLDVVVRALADAMQNLYDDSEFAEPQFISLPEAA